MADAVAQGGRWLVEAGNVLTQRTQVIRIDVLQPHSSQVEARAEVNFVIDLPSTPAANQPPTAVASTGSSAAPATPAKPAIAARPAQPALPNTPRPALGEVNQPTAKTRALNQVQPQASAAPSATPPGAASTVVPATPAPVAPKDLSVASATPPAMAAPPKEPSPAPSPMKTRRRKSRP